MSKSSEVKRDFTVSWQMLKANYKAFLMTELFAFISLILFVIVLGLIGLIIFVAVPTLSFENFINEVRNEKDIRHSILGRIVFTLINVTIIGFLNCQYGLAYDVMSSGDMFSEFKRSFQYFRRFWWQYILMAFISGLCLFLPAGGNGDDQPYLTGYMALDLGLTVIRYLLLFVVIILASGILPSLTAQGSLKRSFIEAYRIIKKYPTRIIKTWGIYFLIFILPIALLDFLQLELYTFFEVSWWIYFVRVPNTILYLLYLFVGFPMSTIVATRIYNNVEFERFKPLVEPQEEKEEEDEFSSNPDKEVAIS